MAERIKTHRRQFLYNVAQAGFGLGAAAAFGNPSALFAAASDRKPIKLCMLSGSEEYKSNESLAAFQEVVEKKFPIKCSRAFWTSKTELPGLDALATADVMLLFTKRLEIPADQLELVKKYCLAGRPIVGVRTASHAFQNWLELDRLILGGDYKGHYGSGVVTKVAIASGATEHPILAGVEPFESTAKLYKNPQIAGDTNLLLTGAIPEHTEPVAWTRENNGGRVFYTSLGGPSDFETPAFRSLLTNAIFWTARQKPVS
jgi:type 1 glutamine amidotransferase